MSCRLEPAIWARDAGQWIPCFDRCQLMITWMLNIKEVHGKLRLHVSVKLLFGVYQEAPRKYVFGGAIQYFAGQRYTLIKLQNAGNF